jgi:hypothetical protein
LMPKLEWYRLHLCSTCMKLGLAVLFDYRMENQIK